MKTIKPILPILLIFLFLGFPQLAGAEPKASTFLSGSGEEEAWMGTYYHGKKIGYTYSNLSWTPELITVSTQVLIKLNSQGIDQSTSFTQKTHLSRDLEFKSFNLLQQIMGNRQSVEGKNIHNQLQYRVQGKGFDRTKSIKIPKDFAPSSTYLLNIIRDGLAVGKKGRYRIFLEPYQMMSDLLYEVLRKETFTYQGKAFDTFVVVQRISGIESTIWVGNDGTVFKEVTNQGLESRKEPKKMASYMDGKGLSVSNMITMSLVKPNREIKNPGEIRQIKLKISELSSPTMIPSDHRQKLLQSVPKGKKSYITTIEINSEPKKPVPSATLPFKQVPDPVYLEDSLEVQSKHGMIRALARELAQGEKDAWKLSLRINQWVFSNLKKELVDTVTALDALQQRRGECQSHTYLFTAIARAAGIPTKIVNGLVYSSEYKGFLYHAWPEVYVGEWRALDPTFGQDLVDATHIKLAEGKGDAVFKLMEFVGRIKIELIDN
jgi:hypothetical protein